DARDSTPEATSAEIAEAVHLRFTDDKAALRDCHFFGVTVTPAMDEQKRPAFRPLEAASGSDRHALESRDVAVHDATASAGATGESGVPVLERVSGRRFTRDFFVGYSPERINPGDRQHRLETIVKVTSGSTPEAADLIDSVYGSIVPAGTWKASSIAVAEAA